MKRTWIIIMAVALLLTGCITINPNPKDDASLPRIEAFIADPSINPGGQQLSGLSEAKIAVDNIWRKKYGQSSSYYLTNSVMSDKYKPWGKPELEKALTELDKTGIVTSYDSSSFNCRHYAAVVQRELAIRGFESWIVVGKDPKVPTGHAWVVAFVKSPNVQIVPIEATALLIPEPSDSFKFSNGVVQTYSDYTSQGWVLQDIYQAQAWAKRWWGLNDFDWWDKADVLKKAGLPTLVTGADNVAPAPVPSPTSTPLPTPTTPTATITVPPPAPPATVIPLPAPEPAKPAPQHIETPMQGVVAGGYSYMNYTKYLQIGEVINGTVQLTGPVNSVDNTFQWQFQVLGPGGESIKVLNADYRNTTTIPFSVQASYAGIYRIRVTHQSVSTRMLAIDLTPAGWGYADLK